MFDNTNQKTISCRIPANIKARLDAICGENCKTIGELMRDMIREKYPEPKQPTIQTSTPATKETPIKTTTGTGKSATKEATKTTPTDTPTAKHKVMITVGKKDVAFSDVLTVAKESTDYKALAFLLGVDAGDLYKAIQKKGLNPETIPFREAKKKK